MSDSGTHFPPHTYSSIFNLNALSEEEKSTNSKENAVNDAEKQPKLDCFITSMGLLSFLVTLVPFLCLTNIFGPCAALECIRDDCIRTRSRFFPTWLEYKENTLSFSPNDLSYKGNIVSFHFFGLNQISQNTLVTNYSEYIIALNISYGDIVTIEDKSFSALTCLDRLDLSHNNLAYLQNDTFSGLERLKLLNLSHNVLEFIIENDFLYLQNLEVLDLSHNKIEMVGSLTFSDLVNLKTLLLNNNRIRKILHFNVFHNLFSLETLNLQSNWLNIVASYMFSQMHSLKTLNLAYNEIAVFLFDGIGNEVLSHVTTLNLSGNYLSDLNARYVREIFNNKRLVLDLNDNRFFCPTLDIILSNFESRGITLAPGRSNNRDDQVRNYACLSTNPIKNYTYDADEEAILKTYEDEDKDIDETVGPISTLSPLDALVPDYLDKLYEYHRIEIIFVIIAFVLLITGILITIDYVLNYEYLRKALCACNRPSAPSEDSPSHDEPIQLEETAQ